MHVTPAARSAKVAAELNCEERMSIVDQVALALQHAVDGVGEIARHLLHPGTARLANHAGDLNPPRLDVDDEEDVVACCGVWCPPLGQIP
jgi:hypothetical protein